MDVIEALRAWLESFRLWVLSRGEFGWVHGWFNEAPVSMLWAIVLVLVVALVLIIGFWPPLKPIEGERRGDTDGAAPQV